MSIKEAGSFSPAAATAQIDDAVANIDALIAAASNAGYPSSASHASQQVGAQFLPGTEAVRPSGDGSRTPMVEVLVTPRQAR